MHAHIVPVERHARDDIVLPKVRRRHRMRIARALGQPNKFGVVDEEIHIVDVLIIRVLVILRTVLVFKPRDFGGERRVAFRIGLICVGHRRVDAVLRLVHARVIITVLVGQIVVQRRFALYDVHPRVKAVHGAASECGGKPQILLVILVEIVEILVIMRLIIFVVRLYKVGVVDVVGYAIGQKRGNKIELFDALVRLCVQPLCVIGHAAHVIVELADELELRAVQHQFAVERHVQIFLRVRQIYDFAVVELHREIGRAPNVRLRLLD